MEKECRGRVPDVEDENLTGLRDIEERGVQGKDMSGGRREKKKGMQSKKDSSREREKWEKNKGKEKEKYSLENEVGKGQKTVQISVM